MAARANFIELPSRDIDAARSFYATVFGWELTGFGPSYACTITGDVDIGLQADPDEVTVAPLAVIQVDDIDAAISAVTAAGGRIVKPVFAFPGGRRFQFLDPNGNELAAMIPDPAQRLRQVRYPITPDLRYFVVRGRLWRCSNPALPDAERAGLTAELMSARRAKGVAMRAGDQVGREVARARVDAAKVALGERGPPWWSDGDPDVNRRMIATTPYADWWARTGQADGPSGCAPADPRDQAFPDPQQA